MIKEVIIAQIFIILFIEKLEKDTEIMNIDSCRPDLREEIIDAIMIEKVNKTES